MPKLVFLPRIFSSEIQHAAAAMWRSTAGSLLRVHVRNFQKSRLAGEADAGKRCSAAYGGLLAPTDAAPMRRTARAMGSAPGAVHHSSLSSGGHGTNSRDSTAVLHGSRASGDKPRHARSSGAGESGQRFRVLRGQSLERALEVVEAIDTQRSGEDAARGGAAKGERGGEVVDASEPVRLQQLVASVGEDDRFRSTDRRRLRWLYRKVRGSAAINDHVAFQLLAAAARVGDTVLAEVVYRDHLRKAGLPAPAPWPNGLAEGVERRDDADNDLGDASVGSGPAPYTKPPVREVFFTGALRVAQEMRDVELAHQILGDLVRCGIWPTVFFMNGLIRVCHYAGDLAGVLRVYCALPDFGIVPHVSTYKLVVRAFADAKEADGADNGGEKSSAKKASDGVDLAEGRGGSLQLLRELMAETESLRNPHVYIGLARYSAMHGKWDVFRATVQDMAVAGVLTREVCDHIMEGLATLAKGMSLKHAAASPLADAAVWLLETAARLTILSMSDDVQPKGRGIAVATDDELEETEAPTDGEATDSVAATLTAARQRQRRRAAKLLTEREAYFEKYDSTGLAWFVSREGREAQQSQRSGAVGSGLMSVKLCTSFVECVVSVGEPVRAAIVPRLLSDAGSLVYPELRDQLLGALVSAGMPAKALMDLVRSMSAAPSGAVARRFCRAALAPWLEHRLEQRSQAGGGATVDEAAGDDKDGAMAPLQLVLELQDINPRQFCDHDVYATCLRVAAQAGDSHEADFIMAHMHHAGVHPTFADELAHFAACVRDSNETEARRVYANLQRRIRTLIKQNHGGGKGGSLRAATHAAVDSSLGFASLRAVMLVEDVPAATEDRYLTTRKALKLVMRMAREREDAQQSRAQRNADS